MSIEQKGPSWAVAHAGVPGPRSRGGTGRGRPHGWSTANPRAVGSAQWPLLRPV